VSRRHAASHVLTRRCHTAGRNRNATNGTLLLPANGAVSIMASSRPYPSEPAPAQRRPAYARGCLAPPSLTRDLPYDGGSLALCGDRFELRVGVPGVEPHMARAAREGERTVGLIRHGDALVLLLRIEGLGLYDLPHDRQSLPPDQRGRPPRPPFAGYAPATMVIDTRVHTIHAVRPAILSPAFARCLDTHIDALDARASRPGWRFHRDLEALRLRHPDTESLLRAAEIVEIVDPVRPRPV
jgi:hypothetical protein